MKREKLWRGKEGKGTRAQLGLKNLGIWKIRKRKRHRKEEEIHCSLELAGYLNRLRLCQCGRGILRDSQSDKKYSMNLGWKYMILPWKGEEAFQELEVKGSMASFDPLESAPDGHDWGRDLIYCFYAILK
ncbi:unnamed protein product [Prunus armeniaca]